MELAAGSASASAAAQGPARRYAFLEKIVAAAALVTLADTLFFLQRAGSTIGVFAVALLAAMLIVLPALRRHRGARLAFGLALLFALILIDDPSLLTLALFGTAASMAALLPRTGAFDDGWRWAKRLLVQWVGTPIFPFADLRRLRRVRRARHSSLRLGPWLPMLALPVAGTLLFFALFSAANPLIGDAIGRLDLFFLVGGLSFGRVVFWMIMTMLVWSFLRPRLLRLAPLKGVREPLDLPGVSPASVTLSLVAFNALFALQNGLDIAFLWSGAPLPPGMTLADYAHRGAYPLIATALLAGLFVLVTLRPGTATAGIPLIRRLVSLWIGQNVLLVASTMLRTADYVEAYSLTRLRIAALIWMALVAVGLLLICYRLWQEKSGAWLINANLVAALIVLTGCAAVDLGAVAAAWNVRHAREAGGRGNPIDLCYLGQLGASSLLSLIELERRPLRADVRERLGWTRNLIMDRLGTSQGDWHGWTYRNHRRLAAADALIVRHRLPRFSANIRGCDGRPYPPPPAPAPTAETLTARPPR